MPLPGQHHAGGVGARPGLARPMPDRIGYQLGGDDHGLLDQGIELPAAQCRSSKVTRRLDRLRPGNQQELALPGCGQVGQISIVSRVLPGHCALPDAGRPAQVANWPELMTAISQVPCLRGSHCVVSLVHDSELKRVSAEYIRACSSVTMPLIGVHLQVPSHTGSVLFGGVRPAMMALWRAHARAVAQFRPVESLPSPRRHAYPGWASTAKG